MTDENFDPFANFMNSLEDDGDTEDKDTKPFSIWCIITSVTAYTALNPAVPDADLMSKEFDQMNEFLLGSKRAKKILQNRKNVGKLKELIKPHLMNFFDIEEKVLIEGFNVMLGLFISEMENNTGNGYYGDMCKHTLNNLINTIVSHIVRKRGSDTINIFALDADAIADKNFEKPVNLATEIYRSLFGEDPPISEDEMRDGLEDDFEDDEE